VAAELAGQIGDGGEDAAGDDFALDFGEPQFDLIEPGGVGGSEVETDALASRRSGSIQPCVCKQ
jgi:hypothetical protein